MQRVGTGRGIRKSQRLKLILIVGKILLEHVTGMKVLEHGFVLQDEPNIFFATGKEEAYTPLSCELDTYVCHSPCTSCAGCLAAQRDNQEV